MERKKTISGYSIWISYLLGLPAGLITIFIILSLPAMISDEFLMTMVLMSIYGKAIISFIIAFLLALGIAGYSAAKDTEKQKPILIISFRYSLIVNLIIWITFSIVSVVTNYDTGIWYYLIPPVIAFLFCTIGSTFTIGLLLSYLIKPSVITLTE